MALDYTRPSSYSEHELELDNIRVKKNQKALINAGVKFGKGFIFGLTISPNIVFAVDDVKTQATKEATKKISSEAAKRISNTAACSAIVFVCGKAAGNNPAQAGQLAQGAAQAASKNPKLAAAFLCGAVSAWCLKYTIFDK